MAVVSLTNTRFKDILVRLINEACEKELDFDMSVQVEGLLGLTIDSKQVMLININNTITKEHGFENSDEEAENFDNSKRVDTEEKENVDEEDCMNRKPLLPMNSYRSPFKRQRVMRQRRNNATECPGKRATAKRNNAHNTFNCFDQTAGASSEIECKPNPKSTPAFLPTSPEIPQCSPISGLDVRDCRDLTLKGSNTTFSPGNTNNNTLPTKFTSSPLTPNFHDNELPTKTEQHNMLNSMAKTKRVRFNETEDDKCSQEKLDRRVRQFRTVYSCLFCRRGFSSSTQLREHMQKHNYGKDFRCQVCSAEFTHKINLKRHLQKKHPGVMMACSSIKAAARHGMR